MNTRTRTTLFSTAARLPRHAFLDGDTEPEATEPAADAVTETGDEVAYEIPRTAEGSLDFSGFESLDDLEATIVETFHALQAGDVDAEALAQLEEIASDLDAVRAEQSARAEAQAEQDARLEALNARVGGPTAEDSEQPETDAAADADPEPADDAAETEAPSGDASAVDTTPVTRVRPRTAALHTGTVPAAASEVSRPTDLLVPAGGQATFNEGGIAADLSVAQLAELVRRDRQTRTHRQGTSYIGRIQAHDIPDSLTFDGSAADADKWAALTAERNIDTLLDQGAMVASGCGPAETVYTHVDDTAVGTLIDVPERFFARGSMEFPETIDMRDFIDDLAGNGGWDDGDASKAAIAISCPTYRSAIEIHARYLRLEFTNLRARSNPELYADVVAKMLKAHQINKHIDVVLDIVAGNGGATALTVDMTEGGTLYLDAAAGAFFTQLELLVESARSRWMLGNNAAVECLIPRWVRGAIRSSLGRRASDPDFAATDAIIDGWCRTRGVRPQFIDYWQHIPGDFVAANMSEFPAACEIVMYPANAVVLGTQGMLDLGSEIRDSTLNADNKYELFTEEFYEAGFMAHEPVIATVATNPNGNVHGSEADVPSTAVAPAHDARGNFDLA